MTEMARGKSQKQCSGSKKLSRNPKAFFRRADQALRRKISPIIRVSNAILQGLNNGNQPKNH
nr:hypothetical protein [Candidatus Krumholzibacteria bacterium]